MSRGTVTSIGALVTVFAVVSMASGLGAQSSATTSKTQSGAAAKKYQVPKTPWGEPDFQGIWGGRHQTTTPLERPAELAGKEFLTDQEIAARQRAENEVQAKKDALVKEGKGPELGLRGEPAPKGATITGYEYNTFWVDTGAPARVFRRTSLVAEPRDGRIPYRPELRPKMEYSRVLVSSEPPKDFVTRTWRDRDQGERCITDGNPASLWSGTGPTEIFQSPGFIVILNEQFRDRRVIPTDGSPHSKIPSVFGDGRGHWEGETLVVDTTNFTDQTADWPENRFSQEWRVPTKTLHMVERFTRTAEDAIDYELSIADPSRFTQPWKIAFPFMKSPTEQAFFEYACHEGNYGMVNMLSAARNKEKAAAGKK